MPAWQDPQVSLYHQAWYGHPASVSDSYNVYKCVKDEVAVSGSCMSNLAVPAISDPDDSGDA